MNILKNWLIKWLAPLKPELIVLVRHGESEHNALVESILSNTYSDDPDVVYPVPDHLVPLTSKGHTQAIAVGEAIKEKYGNFDVVYHSHYRRSIQTLILILRAYSKPDRRSIKIRGNMKLGERQGGYIFGLSQQKAQELHPYYQEFYERTGYFFSRPPGGESQADVCQRVFDFIGEMFRHRAGKKVLIIAHRGTIRGFRYNLEGWSPRRYEKDSQKDAKENCAITVYRRNKNNNLELVDCGKVFH